MQLTQLFSLVALSAWGVLGGLASPLSTRPLEKRVSNSKWSFYDAGLGACGTVNSNSDFIVALNAEDFGDGYPGPHCGKTITLRYNGKTAQAKIMDRCPGCPKGGLDLSRGLFSFFESQDKGIIYGEWDFGSGSAPAPEPVPSPQPPAPVPSPSPAPQQPASSSTPPQASPSPVSNIDVMPSSSVPAAEPSSSVAPSSSVQASSSAAASSSVSPVASPSSPASPSSSLPAPAPSSSAAVPAPSAPVEGDDDEEYDEDCDEWEYEDDEEVSSAVPVASPSAVVPSSSAAQVPRVTPPSDAYPAPVLATPTGAPEAPSPPAQVSPVLNVVKEPVVDVAPVPVNVAPVPSSGDSIEKSIQENMTLISQLLSQLGDMLKALMAKTQKDA